MYVKRRYRIDYCHPLRQWQIVRDDGLICAWFKTKVAAIKGKAKRDKREAKMQKLFA